MHLLLDLLSRREQQQKKRTVHRTSHPLIVPVIKAVAMSKQRLYFLFDGGGEIMSAVNSTRTRN